MPRISRNKNKQIPPLIDQKYNTALYARISKKDKEEESIENQINLIKAYIEKKEELIFSGQYIDNGHTGTNFNRPGFERMMQDIKSGKVNCIVIKDLSRLGRNYLETGLYIENILPEYKVRLISINDDIDSNKDNDFLVLNVRNLINDVYAKDISIKSQSALRIKQEKGEFIGSLAPFGYAGVIIGTNPRSLENTGVSPI